MPSTFQALAVALLALLPGALYELAREQRAGRWGLRGADQIFRLLGFSVAFQVLIAPLTYWLYSHYIVTGHGIEAHSCDRGTYRTALQDLIRSVRSMRWSWPHVGQVGSSSAPGSERELTLNESSLSGTSWCARAHVVRSQRHSNQNQTTIL
ncbi:DUF6338 family protein [Rhodococcus sp. NPDC059968]|uniref:DUF6338 family protein n=1 Tax=Rhodococcus sp. NPDC059968 TaxID=3347017 RepID=UPI00366C211B